jgi:hypothetical protein
MIHKIQIKSQKLGTKKHQTPKTKLKTPTLYTAKIAIFFQINNNNTTNQQKKQKKLNKPTTKTSISPIKNTHKVKKIPQFVKNTPRKR